MVTLAGNARRPRTISPSVSRTEVRYGARLAGLDPRLDEASANLLVGRLDAVFGDELLLSKFLGSREGACCHIIGDAPADPVYRRESYGIGLRKEDEALRARFNGAIAAVKGDGTYDRIQAKYFSFDIK